MLGFGGEGDFGNAVFGRIADCDVLGEVTLGLVLCRRSRRAAEKSRHFEQSKVRSGGENEMSENLLRLSLLRELLSLGSEATSMPPRHAL